MRGAFSRFIDHFLPVRISLRHNLLVTLFRFSEFLFDSLGINLAFLDLASALFKHGKDWLVSEAVQKIRNDAEAYNLRHKQLPIPAESLSRFAQNVGDASAARGDNQVHKLGPGRNIRLPSR